MSIPTYMFDTVVFNRVLDGALDVDAFVGKARFYATHIQLDDINSTSNLQRRQALIEAFNRITEGSVPTESFVLDVSQLDRARLGGRNIVSTESATWGVSAWGMAKWSKEDGLYTSFKAELDVLNKSKPNNIQDTLIAETAIKNRCVLVTYDKDLCTVTKKFGGKCTNTKQLTSDLGL